MGLKLTQGEWKSTLVNKISPPLNKKNKISNTIHKCENAYTTYTQINTDGKTWIKMIKMITTI